MQKTYKVVVSYDGTAYHGWQRQPNKKTIQGVLEKALFKITGKNLPVIGARRTDAGVHALGQTAHFRSSHRMHDEELYRAMNALLPQDIRVISVSETEAGFHARRLATSKVYCYRILNTRNISPFDVRYVLQWTGKLDISAMKEAAARFIRKADFNPFSSNRFLHPVREVYHSDISREDDEIRFTIEANGFLRYMVRTITGTLLEVGRGRLNPGDIERIFRGKKRILASPTAPAKGLCLLKVKY